MASTDKFSDDYVAGLLARDAKDSAIKYSTMGTDAFLSSKTPSNKPKPNTRFLRNIIKDTDSHNAALLAKEAVESRARLRNLVKKDRNLPAADIRRRQLGHIAAHLTSSAKKRQVNNDDKEAVTGKRKRRQDGASDEEEETRGKRSRKDQGRRRRGTDQASEKAPEDKSSCHRSHRRRRSRSEERVMDNSPNGDSRRRSPSPREHRSRSSRHDQGTSDNQSTSKSSRLSQDDNERPRHRSHHQHRPPSVGENSPKNSSSEARKGSRTKAPPPTKGDSDSDSDPLTSIIGPRPPPPVRSRGRGTPNTSTITGIDYRFSSAYDPSADIIPDDENAGGNTNALGPDNDWDQALEALRDRTKWKQQGAERLRAAGFTEEEVRKWESGGKGTHEGEREGNVEAVRWRKKGEGREWDRGKVVGAGGVWEGGSAEEGVVVGTATGTGTGNVNFGRLKGT